LEPVRVPAQGLPEGLSESVSEGLLPQSVLPRALSSACTAGLPEGLPPPLLLDAALSLRDPRLLRAHAKRTRHSSELSGFLL
jgi:hypothetical protein